MGNPESRFRKVALQTSDVVSCSWNFFEICQSVKDVDLGLALLGQCGKSAPASLCDTLNALVDSTYPCENVPGGTNPLPIAPRQAEKLLRNFYVTKDGDAKFQ